MGTKQENETKHEETVEAMEVQLTEWSNQLDDLIAGYHEAGAQLHDAYRLRVDALRERQISAQDKLNVYNEALDNSGTWTAFRAGIKDDMKALKDGFDDLSR